MFLKQCFICLKQRMVSLMKLSKKSILGIALLAGFFFLLTVTIFSYHLSVNGNSPGIFAPLVSYHVELMVVVSTLGIAVGAAVFYLMSERLEAKSADTQVTGEMLLKFMSDEDRKIIAFLVKGRGIATQSEVSHLNGMTRLKAHRAVMRLLEHGIVLVERVGKINKLSLEPALLNALAEVPAEKD